MDTFGTSNEKPGKLFSLKIFEEKRLNFMGNREVPKKASGSKSEKAYRQFNRDGIDPGGFDRRMQFDESVSVGSGGASGHSATNGNGYGYYGSGPTDARNAPNGGTGNG
jgi:hypothetical protein